MEGKVGIGTTTPNSKYLLDATKTFSDGNYGNAILNFEGTQTGTGSLFGAQALVHVKPSANTNLPYVGTYNTVRYDPSGGTITLSNIIPLIAADQYVQFETGGGVHTFSNPVVALKGSMSTRDNNVGTINITDAINIYSAGYGSMNTGGGPTNITNFKGIAVADPTFETYSNVSMANLYGLYVAKQTRGTNNYGIVLAGDGAGADIVFGPNQEARIYSNAGELFVKDGAGNVTQISPHDPETGEWIFYSKNVKTGKVVRVDMERLVKAVEKLTGEKFMIETVE